MGRRRRGLGAAQDGGGTHQGVGVASATGRPLTTELSTQDNERGRPG